MTNIKAKTMTKTNLDCFLDTVSTYGLHSKSIIEQQSQDPCNFHDFLKNINIETDIQIVKAKIETN